MSNTNVTNSNKRPRVAIVGCGWFARVAHIPALKQLMSEGVLEITAICSRSAESLNDAQSKLGLSNIKKYTDLQKLLADGDVDVLDLLLSIPLMPEAIRASLKAGKHVISEKPCAPTVAQGLELLAEHAALGGQQLWGVAENWRFKKITRTIEAVIRSGDLGSIQFADFRHVAFAQPADRGWRGTPDYPGGHVLDSCVHFVAMLREVIGEIEGVNAKVSQRQKYLPPADTVSAVLSFANGAEGSFRFSLAAEDRNRKQEGLSLIGSKGSLFADFRRGRVEVHTASRKRSLNLSRDKWIQGGVYELLSDFFQSLRAGTQPHSSPWEALRDVAVIQAMLESSRLEQPIKPGSLFKFLHGCNQNIPTYKNLQTFKPRHLVECSSIDDVRAAVTEATAAGLQIRPAGAGYSWSPHLKTPDVSIQIIGLNQIFEINSVEKTVRISAGTRLGDLTRALAEQSLCLPSLSFVTDVTIGGAIATATHGTSPKWGTFSDFVRSMKVVLASGEVKTFGPESSAEDLRAARAAVGMLGIIVEAELEVIELPWVRYSEIETDLNGFAGRRGSILAECEHLWVQWTLGENKLRVQSMSLSSESQPGSRPYAIGDNALWASPPKPPLWRQQASRAKKYLKSAVTGLRYAPKPRYPAGLEYSDRDVYLSMQYGLDISQLETAIEQIKSSEFAAQNAGRVVEMKFLKGESKTFLGPNADRDSVLFNMWWPIARETKHTIFDGFESIMLGLKGRPHWGKMHRTPSIEYMKSAYPQWNEFEAVRARLDPAGTFSIFHRPGAEGGV